MGSWARVYSQHSEHSPSSSMFAFSGTQSAHVATGGTYRGLDGPDASDKKLSPLDSPSSTAVDITTSSAGEFETTSSSGEQPSHACERSLSHSRVHPPSTHAKGDQLFIRQHHSLLACGPRGVRQENYRQHLLLRPQYHQCLRRCAIPLMLSPSGMVHQCLATTSSCSSSWTILSIQPNIPATHSAGWSNSIGNELLEREVVQKRLFIVKVRCS
jgi:hypothetical protein